MENKRFENITHFYSGTSNVVLPVPNKSLCPPEYHDKTRLTYYASLFNTVEVNSSFYRLPLAKTILKWTTEVPEYFRFTFKLWKEITHNKNLEFDPANLCRFMERIAAAGNRKGCLLIQFPPKLNYNFNQLNNLLTHLQAAMDDDPWKVAIEFRNRSWHREDIYELLDSYNIGMVIHDMPASATPLIETQADFIYLRFHGPAGGYRGSYADDFLSEYATYIKEYLEEEKTVFVYFNNTMGAAVHNLATLNNMVNSNYNLFIKSR